MLFKDLYEVVATEVWTNTHIGNGTILCELWQDIKDTPYKYGRYEVTYIFVNRGVLEIEIEADEKDRKWLREKLEERENLED